MFWKVGKSIRWESIIFLWKKNLHNRFWQVERSWCMHIDGVWSCVQERGDLKKIKKKERKGGRWLLFLSLPWLERRVEWGIKKRLRKRKRKEGWCPKKKWYRRLPFERKREGFFKSRDKLLFWGNPHTRLFGDSPAIRPAIGKLQRRENGKIWKGKKGDNIWTHWWLDPEHPDRFGQPRCWSWRSQTEVGVCIIWIFLSHESSESSFGGKPRTTWTAAHPSTYPWKRWILQFSSSSTTQPGRTFAFFHSPAIRLHVRLTSGTHYPYFSGYQNSWKPDAEFLNLNLPFLETSFADLKKSIGWRTKTRSVPINQHHCSRVSLGKRK